MTHLQGHKESSTAVLDVRGLLWASEQNVVAALLGRRPEVRSVEVNPVAQTATVVFDPSRTNVRDLRRWVQDCGYHCAGQSADLPNPARGSSVRTSNEHPADRGERSPCARGEPVSSAAGVGGSACRVWESSKAP
ncbi:heavy-metal-associated domain-containing protein [Saccharopolyspora shandongensis]|uniref:heavy-metal-associated domain-containing protein n=1 Tax=Saccharopolyspora shandongensis TaxID=418495 RepID=UPI0034332D21